MSTLQGSNQGEVCYRRQGSADVVVAAETVVVVVAAETHVVVAVVDVVVAINR